MSSSARSLFPGGISATFQFPNPRGVVLVHRAWRAGWGGGWVVAQICHSGIFRSQHYSQAQAAGLWSNPAPNRANIAAIAGCLGPCPGESGWSPRMEIPHHFGPVLSPRCHLPRQHCLCPKPSQCNPPPKPWTRATRWILGPCVSLWSLFTKLNFPMPVSY